MKRVFNLITLGKHTAPVSDRDTGLTLLRSGLLPAPRNPIPRHLKRDIGLGGF